MRSLFAIGVVAAAISACGGAWIPEAPPTPPQGGEAIQGPPTLTLNTVTFEDVPGWSADRLDEAVPALVATCERWAILPGDRSVGDGGLAGAVSDWAEICAEAARLPAGDTNRARYFFESFFSPLTMNDRADFEGLVTGYYEASLRGSWQQKGRYTVPILSRPNDITSIDLGKWRTEWQGTQIAGRFDGNAFVPYPTRAEIENGALAGRQLEILFVDSPVDAFVLHIQGSGRVTMDDGGTVRLGYAGRNGHAYYAIGRELVARGILPLEQVSMPAIRAWLEANPVAARDVMRKNKSFIFFRVVTEPGPIGAMGAGLTPGRSIAVDPAFVPLGIPVFLSVPHPLSPDTTMQRLMVAQDTGSAIKGPLRADFFWGHGREAADAAGVMREQGQFFMLLPKPMAERFRIQEQDLSRP